MEKEKFIEAVVLNEELHSLDKVIENFIFAFNGVEADNTEGLNVLEFCSLRPSTQKRILDLLQELKLQAAEDFKDL